MRQASLFAMTEAEKLASDSDELYTPAWYIDALGQIDLDPAACFGRQMAAVNYTVEDDGLAQPWAANVIHVNPPYSNPLQERFVRKAVAEWQAERAGCVVMLIQAGVSAAYWHECIWPHALLVGFPRGRIAFCGANGVPTKTGGSFSSAVIVLADDNNNDARRIVSDLSDAARRAGHQIAWCGWMNNRFEPWDDLPWREVSK